MKKITVLVLVAMLVSMVLATVAMAQVKMWEGTDIKESGKLIVRGITVRDTALQPFNPASNAMEGAISKLNDKNVANAYVNFTGELYEKNMWGIKGTYHVVMATEIEFLEPTAENMQKVLSSEKLGGYEAKIAIAVLNKSAFKKDFTSLLLTRVKNSQDGDMACDLLAAYATIAQQDSIDELRKILKYNSNYLLQIAAGKALVQLGNRQTVESFVDGYANKKALLIKGLIKELAK